MSIQKDLFAFRLIPRVHSYDNFIDETLLTLVEEMLELALKSYKYSIYKFGLHSGRNHLEERGFFNN